MKTTIEFEFKHIVFHIENNFITIYSKFVQNQKMIFYRNNKHKTREFVVIFNRYNKINDVNYEFDHTIIEITKMFEIK